MNKDWEKIDQLFHQALECPNEEREDFLASAAQRDPELGSKLQALLDAHENNHSFMESPAMRVSLSPEFGRWQTRIAETMAPSSGRQMIGLLLDGKYRLEVLCGRGGMGAVTNDRSLSPTCSIFAARPAPLIDEAHRLGVLRRDLKPENNSIRT